RDRGGDHVLPGRGVPSALPRDESRALQVLSLELRPRRAPEGAVGRRGAGSGGGDHAAERMESHDFQEARRCDAREVAHPDAVQGDAARGYRAALPQRALGQPPARHLRRRRLGRAGLQLARQVRVRDGLAELHETARAREHPRAGGPPALHVAHRDPLRARRLAPRARLRRRAGADRRARAAQPAWAATPLAARCAAIRRFRALAVERAEPLARTLTLEVGKPITQARGELAGLLPRIDFFLAEVEGALADEVVLTSLA